MSSKCDLCRELDDLMVAVVSFAGSQIDVQKGMLFPRSHPIVQRCPQLFARWLDGEPGLAAARSASQVRAR